MRKKCLAFESRRSNSFINKIINTDEFRIYGWLRCPTADDITTTYNAKGEF